MLCRTFQKTNENNYEFTVRDRNPEEAAIKDILVLGEQNQ